MLDNDPSTFKEAIKIKYSSEWLVAMKDEIRTMSINNVSYLVEIPKGVEIVGLRWVYKTKYDSKRNIERFKIRLIVKGFT